MKSLFLLLSLFVNFTLSATRYQIIDVGLLDKDSSELRSINNKSELCGVYSEGRSTYAYVWKEGDSNDKSFRAPNKIFITNSGIVYGSYYDWVSRGFWDLDQETIYKWENPFKYFTSFNCNDIGYPSALYSTGNNIFTVALWDANDLDQLLVMDRNIINRNYQYGVWVYDKEKFTKINHPCLSAAIRINNQSQILGYYFENLFSADGEPLGIKGKKTVIYDLAEGQVTLFNTGSESWGEAINDLGQVAGTIKESDGSFTGFFGTPDQIVKIPDFYPVALNNCGQIIGAFVDNSNKNTAIWENGKLTQMSDLMTLIDNKGQTWDRIDALTDINDLGEIVGQGVYNGKPHGFLLIPLE